MNLSLSKFCCQESYILLIDLKKIFDFMNNYLPVTTAMPPKFGND